MLTGIAKFISLLFHPFLILTYILVLLLLSNPYLFGVNTIQDEIPLVLLMFFSTVLIPGIAVAMLKLLGLINSFHLEERSERIGPYIITSIFYLWLFINFYHNSQVPTIFTSFVLGATIALFVVFFINIFAPISAHTAGMGGLIGMILLLMSRYQGNIFYIDLGSWGMLQLSMILVLTYVILFAGMVGTARMLLKRHDLQGVYAGYLVGFGTQFIAWQFLF